VLPARAMRSVDESSRTPSKGIRRFCVGHGVLSGEPEVGDEMRGLAGQLFNWAPDVIGIARHPIRHRLSRPSSR